MLWGYSNVFYDPASQFNLKDINERIYFEELTHELAKDSRFRSFNFIFFCGDASVRPQSLDWFLPNKILIQTNDEDGFIPDETFRSAYVLIFKEHLKRRYENIPHLHSFPLGIPASIKLLPLKPINERMFNVFYSGNLGLNRLNFYQQFAKRRFGILWARILCHVAKRFWGRMRPFLLNLSSDFSSCYPCSILRFTKAFQAGYTPDDYARILSESKIVLSPAGWKDAECYRMYEAMRQGCVVINEMLPDTDFYKDIPCIQVKDWSRLHEIIGDLLSDSAKLDKLSKDAVRFYNEKLSPMATACYMYSKFQ